MSVPLNPSVNSRLNSRGVSMQLPDGGLMEYFPPYLKELIEKTGGADGPIGKQFVAQPQLERRFAESGKKDPLREDEHEVAPGLIYKHKSDQFTKNQKCTYSGRALWTITRHCAAYCRFCTRGREVGAISSSTLSKSSQSALAQTPHLSLAQINQTLDFIAKEPGLNEVILSGGDPLTIDPKTLQYILEKLAELQHQKKLSIVRIGTRVPVQNPLLLKDVHFQALKHIKNLRLMLHINHPLELTEQTIAVLDRFRSESGAIVMSQSVLLKGVNDSVEVLYTLFSRLAELGVVPYYLYQNDPVYWAKHFTVPISEAIGLWNQLRPILSGVAATARFVIDVPGGYGKISVPEGGAWSVDYEKGFYDFKGKKFEVTS